MHRKFLYIPFSSSQFLLFITSGINVVHVLQPKNQYWIIITWSAYFALECIPCAELLMGFEKCMTYIHHYNVIQYSFTALKYPLCSTSSSIHLSSWALDNHLFIIYVFIVSIVLCFLECHSGITQYAAFSDWLLSLSNMCLSFLHVFHGLITIFLVLSNTLMYGCTQFVYPFIYWRKSWQLWIRLL